MPGRYFTGLGQPVDCLIRNLSEGGCRFSRGQGRLVPGAPVQIFVGSTGPHRASVRWVEGDEAGVTFITKLDADLVARFESSHVPDPAIDVTPGDFTPDEMDLKPQRFC